MSDNDTNIRIKGDTWHALNSMKGPGESFDDVIQDLLEEHDQSGDTAEAPADD